MNKPTRSGREEYAPYGVAEISEYSQTQPPAFQAKCEVLRGLIQAILPKAPCKVWHGSPVWFVDDNPVVGYEVASKGVKLLFWNGQAFNEAGLRPVGKYKAAQAVFGKADKIDPALVRRWLKKAKSNVFDSKAFFKRLREAK